MLKEQEFKKIFKFFIKTFVSILAFLIATLCFMVLLVAIDYYTTGYLDIYDFKREDIETNLPNNIKCTPLSGSTDSFARSELEIIFRVANDFDSNSTLNRGYIIYGFKIMDYKANDIFYSVKEVADISLN